MSFTDSFVPFTCDICGYMTASSFDPKFSGKWCCPGRNANGVHYGNCTGVLRPKSDAAIEETKGIDWSRGMVPVG